MPAPVFLQKNGCALKVAGFVLRMGLSVSLENSGKTEVESRGIKDGISISLVR